MRVVVVGAGVIGVAIAEALADAEVDVSVLDMRSPGRGASQASAGVLAPYTEAHGRTNLLELCARSLDLFDSFLAGVSERSGRAIEHARTGTLEVALSPDEAHTLKGAKAWLDQEGVPNAWLDADATRATEPAVSPENCGALHIPAHGFINVPSLVSALVHSARLSGAVFESSVEAVEVVPSRDHVVVRAGARQYTADHVVIAAGSWSRRVRVAGVAPLPVRPIRGQLLHLAWGDRVIPSRVVWGQHCYTVPWTNGTLLVGATVEDVGFDESTTVAGVQSLTSAVAGLMPDARKAALSEIRVGLRPSTPDGLPIIGPLESAPNVTIATGHYRNGILLAPLTVHLVSRYVLEREDHPLMRMTTPDRFRQAAPTQGATPGGHS